ncbi:type VI secretion system protein TssA [Chitinimonas lacunae]|uniref:Type VI secretion system protein TssA n=1 Tax=Chitinimonas lacunae TaxID=1963018 RepID=A0ABV8MVN6_9NEIS
MSSLDLDALLAPCEDPAPCGPNLEYSAEYLELLEIAEGKPEQQFGSVVIPAEDPSWPQVGRQAAELLGRSKDLRLATLLLRAHTHLDGLSGLSTGLQLITGLLERYWDHLHPELEDGDATMRLAALADIASPAGLFADLRKQDYISVRSVSFSVREVEDALARRNSEDPNALTEERLRQVLNENSEATVRASQLFDSALKSARAIEAIFARADTDSVGLQLDQLIRLLDQLHRPLREVAAVFTVAEPEAVVDEAPAASEAEPGSAAPVVAARVVQVQALPASIDNRQDALKLIQLACDYLEKHEPTNPAPLLLRRAQRLMTMSFIDIIRELAPESAAQIEALSGVKSDKG